MIYTILNNTCLIYEATVIWNFYASKKNLIDMTNIRIFPFRIKAITFS